MLYFCLEALEVVLCPPVVDVAVFVALCTVAVERVGDFVADNRANTAQVFTTRLLQGVEWRLQNCSGEGDIVDGWIVASIYHVARHCPLCWIGWLVKLSETIQLGDFAKSNNDIKQTVLWVEHKLLEYIANFVGVAHLYAHLGKLQNCLLLCFLAQDVVCQNALFVGIDDLVNNFRNVAFCFLTKVLFAVVDTNWFGEQSRCKVVSKLVDGLHFGNTHQCTTVGTTQIAKFFAKI